MEDIELQRCVVENVVSVVCSYFRVSIESVYSKRRMCRSDMARSFIFYILHRDMNYTIPSLCKIFNRKSRTIYHNCDKMAFFLQRYRDIKKDYESICELLKKGYA